MLKHQPAGRSHTCRPPPRCVLRLDAARTTRFRKAPTTESNRYRGTGPSGRVGSVNERSCHHRVVPGQLHDAQTPANRPFPCTFRPPDAFSDWTHQTGFQEGTESNGYRGTGQVSGLDQCDRPTTNWRQDSVKILKYLLPGRVQERKKASESHCLPN